MAKKTQHHRTLQAIEQRGAAVRAATDAVRTSDSFVNFGARLGLGAGSQQDGSHYAFNYTSRNRINLEAAYRSNWVIGLAVDVKAEDMTRAGITIADEALDPEDIAALDDEIEQLGISTSLCDTGKWARLYGGAIAVLLVDGQDMATPLNLDSIGEGQFKGLAVLDRWQIQPTLNNLVTEFGPNLGKPKFYDVTPGAEMLIGQRIHHSRVIRMDGLKLPWYQKMAENGWGQSIVERLYDRIIAFDSTTAGVAQLVYKAHLRTYKIEGLRGVVATGGPALQGLIAQMEFVRQYQTNEGVTIMDAADEFETHSYTFAGLDDVLLQFGQQISGATQIPLVRLFGQSPAGLNSTGESDLRTYYDGVAKDQDRDLRPGWRTVLNCVHRSRLGRAPSKNLTFTFNSLWQMTDTEKAAHADTITKAVTAAEDAGIISQQTALKELRQASKINGVFTHISDDDINAAESEPPDPNETQDPMPGSAPGGNENVSKTN